MSSKPKPTDEPPQPSKAKQPRVALSVLASSPPAFSRAGWLADILRERILDGTYQPGERIREADLQEEFGFSNGPTREALQSIVATGLAERAPWQGVRIVSLSEREIVEIFQLRVALLEYAADLAARFAPPERLAEAPLLKQQLAQAFEKWKSGASHPFFTGQLSSWVLAAAGNAIIAQAWEEGVVKARIYVNTSIRTAMRHDVSSNREHWVNSLIDSIVAGNPVAAREAARELTKQTLKDLNIDAVV
jgi:DNA-binding GntR family transcriptional regulator